MNFLWRLFVNDDINLYIFWALIHDFEIDLKKIEVDQVIII